MRDGLQTAPAGYRLGDPIALHDFLALPPDGRRYTRDEQGRLALMSPDDARAHRNPLALLTEALIRALARPWRVISEPGIAFDPVWSLQGERLPPSRLGRKAVSPDVAVFEGPPQFLAGRPDVADPAYHVFSPENVRLAAELVSPGTWRSDLGSGEADAVDRWRTYWDNGVAELWILNAGDAPCGPLPPRAGLFLRRGRGRSGSRAAARAGWRPLPAPGLRLSPETEVGPAVLGGEVRSVAIPGLSLDLDAFWAEVSALG